MTTFNQQGQKVENQINIGTMTIEQDRDKNDFLSELKYLQKELNNVIESKLIIGENAIDAEMHVKKAVLQAAESHPDKKTLLSHLTSAKDLVTSADKITAGLSSIIGTAGTLF